MASSPTLTPTAITSASTIAASKHQPVSSMLRRVSIAATLISSAPFSQLLAHLFRAVKRANGRIHRLTVHDHDMAFFTASSWLTAGSL